MSNRYSVPVKFEVDRKRASLSADEADDLERVVAITMRDKNKDEATVRAHRILKNLLGLDVETD